MKSEEVIAALRDPSIGFTKDQIREAWDLLKTRNTQLESLAAHNWRPGEKVYFEARGRRQEGVVRKINQKTIAVDVGLVKWKVAPSLLHRME